MSVRDQVVWYQLARGYVWCILTSHRWVGIMRGRLIVNVCSRCGEAQ